MLAAAGFTLVPANTPQRQTSLTALPPHKFVQQVRNNAVIYTYADPTICDCLYVGNQAASRPLSSGCVREEYSQRATDDRSDQRDELGPLGSRMVLFGDSKSWMNEPSGGCGHSAARL